jgi:hypothetical protein
MVFTIIQRPKINWYLFASYYENCANYFALHLTLFYFSDHREPLIKRNLSIKKMFHDNRLKPQAVKTIERKS